MRVPNLYVCSLESFWGKSAFCLGLALTIQEKGYKIGYFKPVGWEMGRDRDGRKIDEDAQLMKEILGLKSPLDIICPFVLGSRYLEESAKIDPGTNQEKVLQAYNEASKGMDIMILEGPYSMGVGTSIGVEPIFLTKMLM